MTGNIPIPFLPQAVLNALDKGPLNTKIFFVHIPKCGGVSIANAIGRKYGIGARLGRTAISVDPSASSRAARECGVDLHEFRRMVTWYSTSRPKVLFVSGHVKYGIDAVSAEEWNVVTVLREPVEKWFSQYFYNRYKASSHSRVEEELDDFIDTPAAREYGSDYLGYLGSWECRGAPSVDDAVRNLRRFKLVGILEDLDRFVGDFRESFGVQLRVLKRNKNPVPASVRQRQIDGELRLRVEELCQPNQAVYHAARRLISLPEERDR
jgi:hypothetical protein